MILSKKSKFRVVKSLSIALLGVYYLVGGIIISEIIEYILPKYNEEEYKKQSSLEIFLEIALTASIIVIFVYILRLIIKRLPSPFENVEGFKMEQLKEINGTVILAYSLFFNMNNMKFKLEEFSKRIDFLIYKKEKSSLKWGI